MDPIPSIFQEVISAALVKYTKLTEKDLVTDPLATKIQYCDSPTAICNVLQRHAWAFHDYNRLRECLDVIVDKLHALSTTPALHEVASLVSPPSPPVQLIFSATNILLAACNRDTTNSSANCNSLVDLFDCIDNILKRLKIDPEVTVTQGMTQILVKIMMELLSVMALATKEVNEGLFRKYGKKLLGENDIQGILRRLDRLTLEEARRTVMPTFEVIYGLVHNLTLLMEGDNALMEGIRRALLDIQQVVTEMAGAERYTLQQKFRRWLSPPDPSTNHNIARRAHHDGTSTWFIEGNTFKEWKTSGGLLWIHGKPGSGKSVLCSTIVHHARFMRAIGLASVGYFYIDFRDPAKQAAHGLLSSLLVQLCTQSGRFCEILSSLYGTHDRGVEKPSEKALTECLKEMLGDPKQAPVFIVVDALDECPNSQEVPTPRERILKVVKQLIELKFPHLHFCITSRPEVDIRAVLDPLEPYSVSLPDQGGQLEDIAEYVKSVVLSDATMREWPKEEKKLVIDTLTRDSGGMFRWAFCQLETLRRCPLQKIPSTLKALPRTLDETYERTLQGIDEENWKYAHRIFQFLTVSARPLYVQEVAEVFAISTDEEKGQTTGIPDFNPRWRQPDAESAVLSVCASLVAVVKINGEPVIQYTHFSVQEFLTSNRLRDHSSTYIPQFYVLPRLAHTLAAKACLSVLLQLKSRIHKNSVKGMFPLATYAAEHWVRHAQRGDISLIKDGMNHLFEIDKPQFAAWIWVYDIDNPSGPHMDRTHPGIPESAPLYYAALCGFLDMVKRLVESYPDDVTSQGRDGGTPLHAALRNGHSDVALLLLEHKADTNARDYRDETPLQIASRLGDIRAMQSLIDGGANLNAKNRDNETPLSLASRNGRLEAARLLLKNGAGVDYQVAAGRTALHVAAEHGHFPIVYLLLNNGANVDAREKNLRTPLHVAADSDQERPAVTRLLLLRGAKVDAREASELTPLHMASSGGQVETARLLLDFRADVDAGDGEGWTALHLAAYNGYLQIAQLLLSRGAAWESETHDGNTPCQLALAGQHTEIVQLLQQRATNVGN